MKPEDRSRNILIATVFVIIIILVLIFIIRKRQSTIITQSSPIPTPVSAFQDSLKNNFGITVPDNASKADLKDVTGGNQMGLVTVAGNDYTVIADLEDPLPGYFYQAWAVNGNDTVSLGKLALAKGGWLIDFKSSRDIKDHKTIWVTIERYTDATPEKHILEGSF